MPSLFLNSSSFLLMRICVGVRAWSTYLRGQVVFKVPNVEHGARRRGQLLAVGVERQGDHGMGQSGLAHRSLRGGVPEPQVAPQATAGDQVRVCNSVAKKGR